jgi:wyosine [tRNA(Phe)-imidazoG37] synthetase (radical SAM superfamily)
MSNHIFGPVPSRRLGRSLGVDLVPYKTCTYDCIYCQLGRTTCKTLARKEWVPLDAVLDELRAKLSVRPDYITLGGSGEPTLFSRIDELIERIKAMTDVPIAVLTNGSLLWDKQVRQQLSQADLVIPSLDAGDESLFRLVNRPHEAISFDQMLAGLIDFRREYRGRLWLEVFLVGAVSVFEHELANLRHCATLIQPDRVQLNTVTRPPADDYAVPVSADRLAAIARSFEPPAEVICDVLSSATDFEGLAARDDILGLLRRRPCSIDDIAAGLGSHRNEVLKHLEHLVREGLAQVEVVEQKNYYRVARPTR